MICQKNKSKLKQQLSRGKLRKRYFTWHDKNIQSNAPYGLVLTTQLNHLASLAKWLSVHLWTKWLWVRVQLQSPLFLLLGYLTSSITGWIFWTGRRYFNPWKVKHFANVSLYVLIFKFRYWRNSFRQKFNRTLGSSYDKCGFRAIFMKFRDPLNATTFLVFNN